MCCSSLNSVAAAFSWPVAQPIPTTRGSRNRHGRSLGASLGERSRFGF
jgi:hypothetical protein